MTRVPITTTLAAVAASFVIAGCAKTDGQPAADTGATSTAQTPAAPAAATPNMVTFTAKEFSFEGPDTIPAGLTMFHLTDAGQQLHHVQILKLEQGKTFADFQAGVKSMASGPPPAWVVMYGGVNPPPPGETTTAMQVMEPGNYAVVCFVEGADHVPHLAKGMMKSLTVTPGSGTTAEPNADVTLTLTDYAFNLSKPLVAGRQLIRVQNAATQPHEVVLVQLAPGKTMEDLAKWVFEMKGPPPGKPMGGIPAFVAGKNSFFEANLTPGDYGMICFVPDAKDGKMHYQHGMTRQFKVS